MKIIRFVVLALLVASGSVRAQIPTTSISLEAMRVTQAKVEVWIALQELEATRELIHVLEGCDPHEGSKPGWKMTDMGCLYRLKVRDTIVAKCRSNVGCLVSAVAHERRSGEIRGAMKYD